MKSEYEREELGQGERGKYHDVLAMRCRASAARLRALVLHDGSLSADLNEAAVLLGLVYTMLTDDEPLDNWDLIDTQLHQLLAAGDVPTPEEAEKIMQVRRLLRKVAGQ